MQDIIELINEEGETEQFYLIEEIRLGGTGYILVTETLEDGADAYILKDISEADAEEAEYVFVDDESELEAVTALFSEVLEDIELE